MKDANGTYDARCFQCRHDEAHTKDQHVAWVADGEALLLARMDVAIAALRRKAQRIEP